MDVLLGEQRDLRNQIKLKTAERDAEEKILADLVQQQRQVEADMSAGQMP